MQAFSNIVKGANIFSYTDYMNLIHSLATNETSQRVKKQMIWIIDEYNIRHFSYISESKNTGLNKVSRLLIKDNINEYQVYLNIKTHVQGYLFPWLKPYFPGTNKGL